MLKKRQIIDEIEINNCDDVKDIIIIIHVGNWKHSDVVKDSQCNVCPTMCKLQRIGYK